jgi:O-antigen ligase
MIKVALLAFAIVILIPIITTLRPGSRAVIAASLAVPGLFTLAPLLPLNVVWPLVSLLAGINLPPKFRSRPLACLSALIAVYIIALAWSPVPSVSLYQILSYVAFAGFVYQTTAFLIKEPDGIDGALNVLGLGVILEAMLTSIFRISPSIEGKFLGASFNRLIGGTSIESVDDSVMGNNVRLATKAGGVFLNGNAASLFLGVAFCLYLSLWLRKRRKFLIITSLFSLFGVIMTGSKTGLTLAIFVPVFALFLFYLMRTRESGFGLPVSVVLVCAVYYIATLIIHSGSGFSNDSSATLDIREKFWALAFQLFPQNWLTGFGWGGWSEVLTTRLSALDLPRTFPLHNLFLQNWADAGILAPILVAGYFIHIGRLHLNLMRSSDDARFVASYALSLGGFLWILVHSMGDNTTLFVDAHGLVPVGFLLAIVIAADHRNYAGSNDADTLWTDDNDRTARRPRTLVSVTSVASFHRRQVEMSDRREASAGSSRIGSLVSSPSGSTGDHARAPGIAPALRGHQN